MPRLFMHLWSLSVEEQFYLLWPLALALAFRWRTKIAVSVLVFAPVFRVAFPYFVPSSSVAYAHYSFPATMDCIAIGCLLAMHSDKITWRFHWLSTPTLAVAVLGATIALWGTRLPYGVDWRAAFWGIIPALIALFLLSCVRRADWILNNPVAYWGGALSYSLYLWQQPFIYPDGPFAHAWIPVAICAVGSYLLVERPMLRYSRRTSRPAIPSLPVSLANTQAPPAPTEKEIVMVDEYEEIAP